MKLNLSCVFGCKGNTKSFSCFCMCSNKILGSGRADCVFSIFFYFKRAPGFRLFFFFYSLFGSSTKTEKSIINRKLFYIKLTKKKDTHISSKAKGKKKNSYYTKYTH